MERHTVDPVGAAGPETDPQRVAKIEALNGLRQYDRVVEIIEQTTKAGEPFTLQPSLICELNRIAIEGVKPRPGQIRTDPIYINNTPHVPPPAADVPRLVQEMCDYINVNARTSPLHQAAYLLWRLNWIHPFPDGNGRTSRAISYLVLSVRAGYLLPGKRAIPERIASDKAPYYAGLDSADAAWKREELDVSELEHYLGDLLIAQLQDVVDAAAMPAA